MPQQKSNFNTVKNIIANFVLQCLRTISALAFQLALLHFCNLYAANPNYI